MKLQQHETRSSNQLQSLHDIYDKLVPPLSVLSQFPKYNPKPLEQATQPPKSKILI